jgi:hypothetical protein
LSGVDRFAMDLDFKKANSIVIASASEAIHRASEKQEWIASSLPLLAMTSL